MDNCVDTRVVNCVSFQYNSTPSFPVGLFSGWSKIVDLTDGVMEDSKNLNRDLQFFFALGLILAIRAATRSASVMDLLSSRTSFPLTLRIL